MGSFDKLIILGRKSQEQILNDIYGSNKMISSITIEQPVQQNTEA